MPKPEKVPPRVSVEKLLSAIRLAVRKTRSAEVDVETARQLITEARDQLRNTTVGAGAEEPAESLSHLGQVLDNPGGITRTIEGLARTAAGLDQYATRVEGPAGNGTPHRRAATSATQRPGHAAPFTNEHGDCYPPEAAELAKRLPKRVVPKSGARTYGMARWNGHVSPAIVSGKDALIGDAERLLREHGCTEEQAEFLRYHVEIKVATIMLRREDMTDVEVAINYTPCGVETQQEFKVNCEKLLRRIFPPDGNRSLTVYGTCQDNRPYKTRYGRPQP